MSAPSLPPQRSTPAKAGGSWKPWAWFGAGTVLFLTYLFGGAWLVQNNDTVRSASDWLERWVNWIWLGGMVLAAVAALGRMVSGEDADHR